MEEFKGRDIAINQVTVFFFFVLVTQLSEEFWLRNSSLSYYRVVNNMVCFHTPISLLEVYVSVGDNQRTLNNLKYIQSLTL